MEEIKNNIEPGAAFSLSCSPGIPELLLKLKCSLAISTYQAGKIIFISPQNQTLLVQLPRTFLKPMGIAAEPGPKPDKMAIACKDEIIVFSNSPELGYHYPAKPQTYDAFYVPRITYHTGELDIHDLVWGNNKLFAVNTLFSCIVTFDHTYNFNPYWQPHFISKLAAEDRCHLNGMALIDGKPAYATAFGHGDSFQSWRENVTSDGVLIDIANNEIVAGNLPMPHSPRMINGELFVLFSATGELAKINIANGKVEIITKIDGFVRGMAHCGDYIFIGLSKPRKTSATFAKLNLEDKKDTAGICIIHLPSAKKTGEIIYSSSVEEIYDVNVLQGIIRPNILNTIRPEYKQGLAIPNATFWASNLNK